MSDPELEQEERSRRGRRRLVTATLGLTSALILTGAWVGAQVPAATPLSSALPGTGAPAAALDTQASELAARLAAASGRTLASLADRAQAPVANAGDSDASTVGSADGATEAQAQANDELTAAEEKSAEGLALTPEQAAAAEAKRKAAQKQAAEQAAAADAALDAAIDAAISAARSQSTTTVPVLPEDSDTSGSLPQGTSTNTAQVLQYVRKYFPADEVGNAMAVSRCESGHANRVSKQNANGTHDFGVFQLNDGGTLQAALRTIGKGTDDVAKARKLALDAKINVEAAHAIWKNRGWQPWTCAAQLKIVAGLYQRTPGPMAGKYDDDGRAL
jgi:hypothetical protein